MKPALPEFESTIKHALRKVEHLRPSRRRGQEAVGSRKRSLDAALLASAARQLGIRSLQLDDEMQVVSDRSKTVGFVQNMPWTLSALDRLITNDKALTKYVLAANGLPVARGAVVHTVQEAVECYRNLGPPVVVKPITGSGGRGIAVDIRSEEELVAAAEAVVGRNRRILVEECLASIDLRVMVVAHHAVAAMLRVPAHVTGDGQSTVGELVARKNAIRRANPYLKHAPIKVSSDVIHRLARRGLSPDSVLPAGERFFLHYKANLSAGGDSFDVTPLIHPDLMRLAERAAGCFGRVRHAGVDILAERLDASLDSQRSIVCEINCNNDMPMHEFPLFGEPVRAARLELAGYFGEQSTRSRMRNRSSLITSGGAFLRASMKRGMRAPGGAPVTHTSLLGWSELWQHADEPLQATPPPTVSDLRHLDQEQLTEALAARGLKDMRGEGRLLRGEQDGHHVIVERSRTSVFAKMLAKRGDALHRLLRSSDVPACRVGRFKPSQRPQATALFRSDAGPWNLRAVPGRPGRRLRYSIASEDTLHRAWERLRDGARALILEQASRTVRMRVLLVDEMVITIAVVPATIVGDGTATVTQLMEQRKRDRDFHPIFHHHPAKSSDVRLKQAGLQEDTVLPAGRRVVLGRSPYLATGADTVGFSESPMPPLTEIAFRVRNLIGGCPILAVDFAARPPANDEQRAPYWSVSGIDPDPVLADFAWPRVGYSCGSKLYSSVAETLLAGQRYDLPPFEHSNS